MDHIDIYRPARLDGNVPIEETVGAIAEMVTAGYVRYIGLSEIGLETARRAQAVAPVCDVQIEYGLASRGIEEKILPGLRELGIGVTAYGVLSRGLLSGSVPQGKGDFRARPRRFSGENLAKNQALTAALKELAASRGVTAVQMAIAWVLAKGEDIVPVIGSRKVAQVNEALLRWTSGYRQRRLRGSKRPYRRLRSQGAAMTRIRWRCWTVRSRSYWQINLRESGG